MNALYLVITALSILASSMMAYQGILALAAFLKAKKLEALTNKHHRFALVICARNEQMVIGHLLDSLFAQEYPKEAFDVFVVADNCTDETAAVALGKGAKVYTRQNHHQIGKGYALGWFFKRFLLQYRNKYDAIGIFDADNLVEPQFLHAMNAQLCAGEVAAMGYRDSKNPTDSWVSGCMSLSFWTMSRFYLQPRSALGLSAVAGGTGYVFKTELIASGWDTTTISEDTEFSMQIIAQGHRIAYAPDAKFYDEQPLQFTASMRQRRRWAAGTCQCVRKTGPALIKAAFSRKTRDCSLDGLLYLLAMPACAISILLTFVQMVFALLLPNATWTALIPFALSMIGGAAGAIGQGMLTLMMEKKFSLKMIKSLVMYPFFLFTTGLCYLFSFVAPTIRWKPIEHGRCISLSQLERGK